MFRDKHSWTHSNVWKSRKHLRIEGRKWEVLPNGKFNEQRFVDCDTGVNRSFESSVPQCLAWDGFNPQLGGEAESLPASSGGITSARMAIQTTFASSASQTAGAMAPSTACQKRLASSTKGRVPRRKYARTFVSTTALILAPQRSILRLRWH